MNEQTGAMKLNIINRRNESIDKLPAAAGAGSKRRLQIKQQLFYLDPKTHKKVSIISHMSNHGKTWAYWFKRIGKKSKFICKIFL